MPCMNLTESLDLYAPRPNVRGGMRGSMTRPPTPPIGLRVEAAMASAEINGELVCPPRTPNFPLGTHDYNPPKHSLIEEVSKSMISRQEDQAKFNEHREKQGSHDEVYTDGLPLYLPYHEPPLVIKWQGHTCSFLLDTKPLWHWGKWKSGPASKRESWPWRRPTGKCPLWFEATGQLLYPAVVSNQVGCSCTWQRSLSLETDTRATEEIPALNQSWSGRNQPTWHWPY